MGQAPAVMQQACGHRYHEAAGAEIDVNVVCACGIFAIGRCSDCGKYVCGEHGELHDGQLRCTDDINRSRAESVAAAQRADKDAKLLADQIMTDTVVSTVARGSDAMERWLLAQTVPLRSCGVGGFNSEKARLAAIDRVRNLIKEVDGARAFHANGSLVERWLIDVVDVIAWLRSRRSPDTRLGLLRTIDGWRIGSEQEPFNERDAGWAYDLILMTDGRVTKVDKDTSKVTRWQLSQSQSLLGSGYIGCLIEYLGLS
jgi:hypothetical protein